MTTKLNIHNSVHPALVNNPERVELDPFSKSTTPVINTAWWIAKHAEFCDKMKTITKAKNADYSGSRNYPFDNFETIEKVGIAKTEIGFLTRMMDKISRISCIIHTGEQHVKDETVEDTLLDLANYSLLLAGYLQSKK